MMLNKVNNDDYRYYLVTYYFLDSIEVNVILEVLLFENDFNIAFESLIYTNKPFYKRSNLIECIISPISDSEKFEFMWTIPLVGYNDIIQRVSVEYQKQKSLIDAKSLIKPRRRIRAFS